MKILAVDTTSPSLSVAVCEDENILASFTASLGNTHSETLLPTIERLLFACGVPPKEIDLFAVTAGPGSFTGVRIGVATVKGLCYGTGKPCVGVSAPEAIAEGMAPWQGLICPVMNARREQVYTALFRSDGEKLTRLWEDTALPVAELDEKLALLGEPVRFAGDGYDVTVPNLKKTSTLPTPPAFRLLRAESVARIALREYGAGRYCGESRLSPVYLRPCQAERERNARLMKEAGDPSEK